MSPEIESLTKAERDAAAAVERARTLDEAAASKKDAATKAYTGDDTTYRAVEAADVARRRTSLDLALATQKAQAARDELDAAMLVVRRARLAELTEATSEEGLARRLQPFGKALLKVDAELCRLHRAVLAEIDKHNEEASEQMQLAHSLGGVKSEKLYVERVALALAAICGAERRRRGDPAPADSYLTDKIPFGSYADHLVRVTHPAEPNEMFLRQAEADAERIRDLK
jgi:hypothetical protein